MSFLSNWRSDRNHHPGEAGIVCRVVRREELSGATRLVLADGPHKASDVQVVDFLRYALARGIDTGKMWVAEREGEILTAILPIPSAGRTMLLLASGYYASEGHRVAAGMLLERMLERYAAEGTQMAQILLDPGDREAAKLFSEHGFEQLAELLYLETGVRRGSGPVELPEGWRLVTYSAETHGLFARTIAATYVDSRDCPALAGRRDIEDIVAGHRATGEFDPGLWFVLLDGGGEGAGVVLLAPTPESEMMELVYLGLTPGARGKGLGDLLMRHAFYTTQAYSLPTFTLAVDSGNTPALKLYYRHGLKRVHAKVAFMRELRRAGEGIPTDSSTALPQGR